MADAAAYKDWLDKNADKAGTTDYVTVKNKFDSLAGAAAPTVDNRGARAPAPTPAVAAPPVYGSTPEEPFAYTDQGLPIGSGTGGGAAGDPNSAFATIGRGISGTITGFPDLANQIHNAGARAAGQPEVPLWQPELNRIMGVPEMDPKAGIGRQLGEAGLSALGGGGLLSMAKVAARAPSAVAALLPVARKFLSTTAAPAAGGVGGAMGGESLAKYLKLDPQTGALIGGVLGGGGAGAAPSLYDKYSHNWYASHAKTNAPEIAAAMQRMGGQATPGQLGDNIVQGMERQIGSSIGAKEYIESRRQSAHDVIGDALNRYADARGQGIDPNNPTVSGTTPNMADVTPGTIGERLTMAARESAEGLRDRADASQATLMDRIGTQTPVELRPVQEAGMRMQLPGSGLEPAMRANIAHRLGPAVEDMLIRRNDDRNNQPLMFRDGQPVRGPVDPYGPSANGAPPRQPLPTEAAGELTRGNGGFRDPGSVAAPYADVRAYRTELGRDVPGPTGQRLGPAAQLYGPTTEAMRATALREGVNRQDFDNTMARTQAVETRGNLPGDPMGDYGNLLGLGEKKPLEAYSYLTDARQNAGDMGMIEATQHPSIGGIMGDQIKLIGKETINNPDQGAAGPRQLGAQLRDMHPESRSIMFGDQAPGMTDVMNTSQAFNYPTSQTGLHKAVGGSTDRNMLGVMLSNVLDNMGGTVGAALTMGAMPILTRLRALGLNSPHAINALGGGPAPPMNFSDLMAGLTAAETAAQERSIVRKPGR